MSKLILIPYLLIHSLIQLSFSSLLPGLSPTDFHNLDPLPVFALKLTSPHNRLPFDYYSLPFCSPSSTLVDIASSSAAFTHQSLSHVLHGERPRLTAYDLRLLKPVACYQACTTNFTTSHIRLLYRRAVQGFRVRLTLDDLPVVERDTNAFRMGYSLGQVDEKHVDLVNHLQFTVMYHAPDDYERMGERQGKVYRIVGFEVKGNSIKDNECPKNDQPLKGETEQVQPLQVGKDDNPTQVRFTYSVKFVESRVRWATRFDTLLKVSRGRRKMQMFAIVNSMMLAVFLTATCGVVLLRTLRRDCARYGIAAGGVIDDLDEDFDHDVGWRMLRGDVFRAPKAGGVLSVLAGTGVQLVVLTGVTLIFALLGVVRPERRGNWISGLVLCWVLSSGLGGYVAARLHKAMGGVRWKLVTLGVGLMLPGVGFGTFFIVNVGMWMMGSIGAAPLVTMIVGLFVWLGVSVPLAFVGTYLGYSRRKYDFPVRTNEIPRPIPKQPRWLGGVFLWALAGIVPFGVVCIELRVILNSIYADEFYHFFGFLVAVLSILAITCAEVSVVVVFVKLSHSDYGWWWNSWMASASSGAYVFLYSVYYLMTSPGMEWSHVVSNFLFVMYSMLGAVCFALVTGTIGFLASLAFVRRIYGHSVDD